MPAAAQSAIDDRLLAFERAAASGTSVPDIDAFLPPDGHPDRTEAVCELARVALELRWGRGDRPVLDDYFCRYPELGEPQARAAVAFEEYRQRILAGDRPSRETYHSRYGIDVSDWPAPDARTLRRGPTSVADPRRNHPTVRLTALAFPATPELPQAGQTIAGFHLLSELGRGAFARVFLAEQPDLAGRQVALKVSAVLTGEVRTLARLQHTNIVPVYSVHRSGPVQAVCMPYFGGTTLASVLAGRAANERRPLGQAITAALSGGREHPSADLLAPALTMFETATHSDAVLSIGERLADALAHAHERGIIHRDIKPANILIADDGQPMLLDFNLAQDASEAERARAGGTLPYMSPEQLGAFAGEPRAVDARSDVYSLGVLLYQLLTGRLPFPEHSGPTDAVVGRTLADRAGDPPRVRPHNPDVGGAAESIVRKCLVPDPGSRYPSAAALRDDLARQQANLPLRHAPEPLRERAQKWVRRNPRLLSPPAVLAYTAALLLAGSAIGVQTSLSARARRQDEDRLFAHQHYEEFTALADRVRAAAGAPTAMEDVFRLGTAALDRYGATQPGWETRDEVVRLSPEIRDRLRSDVGELAFLTARAAARVRRDAELAARLNTVAGDAVDADAKPAVAAQRSELTGLIPAEIVAAVSDGGRGELFRAHDLAARGRYRDALPLATSFVARNPDDFGGWFLKGRCHEILGQYDDARGAYSICVALRPQSAWPVAARGELAFRNGKDLDQARADLDRAVRLDPHLTVARLNRALLLRRVGRYDDALADLDILAAEPKAPTRIYFVRAQVREAAGDKTGAAADLAEGMRREPTDAASFVTRGLAREPKDRDGALADFRAAEKLDPTYPDAIANQAWLLGEKMNRPADALEAVDRLLALYPDHHTGRGGRAVLLARLGRNEEAVAAARRYLKDAPHAATYYQAACVFAIVSKSDPQYRDEAVRLTAIALLRGFGHDFLLTDEDLNPIRDNEQFRKLAEGVKVMKTLGEK